MRTWGQRYIYSRWSFGGNIVKRIETVFQNLKNNHKTGFISFIMAGDGGRDISRAILEKLPECGVDIIELGMPFTDPMADGITIQNAGLRALKSGQTMIKTLEDVAWFREKNQSTPIILMGYYNPIYIYGVDKFLHDAKNAGVDGLIIVDLPPEEDSELCLPAHNQGIDFVRLLTPTTTGKRFDKTLRHAQGFLYYVSVSGVTGTKTANLDDLTNRVAQIKTYSTLPVAVGFGIKTADDVLRTKESGADAIVVGSAIVERIGNITDKKDVSDVLDFVKSLTQCL